MSQKTGADMSEIPLAQPVAVPQTPIAEDMPCMICGYNLRGLMIDGRCPECGSAVSRSVHGNLLRYADAEWLAKLLLGVRLMLWSILIAILVSLIGGIVLALGGPRAITGITAIFMAGLDVAAALLITVQEPRISLTDTTITWRKAVRVGAIVAFLGLVLEQIGVTSIGIRLLVQFGMAVGAIRWFAVIGMILGMAGVVALFGKLVYLRQFALRVPDAPLARSTRIVMWGYGISKAAALLVGLLGLVFMIGPAARAAMLSGAASATTAPTSGPFSFPMTSTQTPPAVVSTGPTTSVPVRIMRFAGGTPSAAAIGGIIGFATAGCIGGLGGVVFGVWYLVLLGRYSNAFRDALAYARQFSAAAPPPSSQT
jgi:hypothetical protein